MKNSIIKKALALVCALSMVFTLCACSSNGSDNGSGDSAKVYKVGICNYVDDASLNQIVDNIQARLKAIGEEKGVTFDIKYDNCPNNGTRAALLRYHPN